MNKKGSICSINGKKYELEIYNILKNTELNGNIFNTQNENELGGCSSKNDIECNMNSINDISIEIKKLKTPDWMQCSLKYDDTNKKWIGSLKNKIPEASKKIFENLHSCGGVSLSSRAVAEPRPERPAAYTPDHRASHRREKNHRRNRRRGSRALRRIDVSKISRNRLGHAFRNG